MDNLFEIIQTEESYNGSSRQDDINYLLQETFTVGDFNPYMIYQLRKSVDEIITSIIEKLHKTGMFINGLQPYNFQKFIDTKTILLIQSKIFSYRDEQYPPMDTVPRKDFIL